MHGDRDATDIQGAKHASTHGIGPTTRNCPAQNVHGAKVGKPGPQETRTLKSEHKFRLPLRSLPKSLLSPWKHAVRLCHSSSKFGVLLSFSTWDPPRSPDLTYFSTLIFYYFPTNSFFWPRRAILLPGSLCLKGCYCTNKQTSFMYPKPHFSKLSSNFTFSKKPPLIAQMDLRCTFSVLRQPIKPLPSSIAAS